MENVSSSAYGASISLVGIGVLLLMAGILVRIGISKIWFLAERVPGIVIPSFVHGFIPAGLAFFVLGISMMSVTSQSVARAIFFCVVSPLWMASIVLAVWQPWWIQPAWFRWLEEHHSRDIIITLQEEGRAMGRWKWQRRVATQEGLKQWVAEVRQKRGLD